MAKSNVGDNRVKVVLDEFRDLVKRYLELYDPSKKKLAEEAGISYATLCNFLRGDTPYVRYATVDKILFAIAHELRASDAPPPSPPSKKRARKRSA